MGSTHSIAAQDLRRSLPVARLRRGDHLQVGDARVLLELGAELDHLGVVVLEVPKPADLGQVPREGLGRQVSRLHGAHQLWRCSGSSCPCAALS